MKVLASDFDGTLLFDDQFRDDDLKKIKEFQQQGHMFGLCSGRPFQGIQTVCHDLIDFDFYILCTGALVLNKNHEVLFKSTITHELLERFYQHYQDQYPIFIQANFKIYTFETLQVNGIVREHISSLDEVNGDIYGLSMNAFNDENARCVCQEIEQLFPELTAHQNKEFIDITEKGCSKGLGIQKLKEAFHIQDIAGIGDSYNDIPMLETVDHSFTFHDSPDSLKEIADDIVDSVAQALGILME